MRDFPKAGSAPSTRPSCAHDVDFRASAADAADYLVRKMRRSQRQSRLAAAVLGFALALALAGLALHA